MRGRSLGVGLLVMASVAVLMTLTLGDVSVVAAKVEALRDGGIAARAGFSVVYALAVPLMAPASLLTLVGGFCWGLSALPFIILGACGGASLSYFFARSWLRVHVASYIAARPRLAALDGALARDGWIINGLLRLSPVAPFGVLNYVIGVSGITYRAFISSTLVGMLPGTLLYTMLGASVTDVAVLLAGDVPDGGLASRVIFLGGLGATAVATVLVGWRAREELARRLT